MSTIKNTGIQAQVSIPQQRVVCLPVGKAKW